MSDLVEATGLQPGSLYQGFGDKETLYELSIKHYEESVINERIAFLDQSQPLKTRFKNFFTNLIRKNCKRGKQPGCMITRGAIEADPDSKRGRQIEAGMDAISQKFSNTLETAVEKGELVEETPIVQLSRLFSTILHGLNVHTTTMTQPEPLLEAVEPVFGLFDQYLPETKSER